MSSRAVEHHDEADLVDRARCGEPEAFAELVRRHQREVFTLALRLVSNPDLAGDVAQETFVRAWRAMPGFRADSSFSTWIHRITVNTAWSLRRRRRRHDGAPLDDEVAALADPGPTPEQAGENLELRGRLLGALAALPEPQRAVVVLKDVYGWTHREIARALGITVTAAKVRLHRARARLRERLEGEPG